jgi:hypothetical protein
MRKEVTIAIHANVDITEFDKALHKVRELMDHPKIYRCPICEFKCEEAEVAFAHIVGKHTDLVVGAIAEITEDRIAEMTEDGQTGA